MNDILKKEIISRIKNYENPKRITFTKKYPFLEKPVIVLRCLVRSIQNILNFKMQILRENNFFNFTIASFQSELRKKAPDVDVRLQENKIYNMKKAVEKLNGIVIKPGKVFSFWHVIGNPSSKNGYAEGRVYSEGRIVSGIGGGLCQLSTFVYWLFLHAPVKILERYPHSLDAFPGSKQNISSRSGSTVIYNFIDLKIKNDFEYPIQLKIWFTDDYIKGEIMSVKNPLEKFNIIEKNHYFIKANNKIFQYNEIYKEVKNNGEPVKEEKITSNFSLVLFDLKDEYIKENDFKVLDFGYV